MSRLYTLHKQYKDFIGLPWKRTIAPSERVIFLIYNKAEERRMATMVSEYELSTRELGHGWKQMDVSRAFSQWIARHEYREAYFEDPEGIENILEGEFVPWLVEQVHVQSAEMSPADVFALTGTIGLFGFLKLSDLIKQIAMLIKGRLLVFFPGDYENNNYRFLDARDGWSYLAVPLTGQGEI